MYIVGTVTVEFRKDVYITGHCYVSSHIVACDGIPEDQILAEDIMYQVGVSRIMPSLLYAASTAGHKVAAAPSDHAMPTALATRRAEDAFPVHAILWSFYSKLLNIAFPK